MTAAIDLGISTGFGLLVGLVAYLVMWLFDLISQPQRFPNARAHIERPRAAEIDLVGRHHGGSVATDLHHHERQWGAAIEASAATAEAGRGDVMCLGAVQAGSAQCGNDRGAGGGIDGFGVGHERIVTCEINGGE